MIWVIFILGTEVKGKPSGNVLVRKCPESQDLIAGPDVSILSHTLGPGWCFIENYHI